jgi:hypothetical protein
LELEEEVKRLTSSSDLLKREGHQLQKEVARLQKRLDRKERQLEQQGAITTLVLQNSIPSSDSSEYSPSVLADFSDEEEDDSLSFKRPSEPQIIQTQPTSQPILPSSNSDGFECRWVKEDGQECQEILESRDSLRFHALGHTGLL